MLSLLIVLSAFCVLLLLIGFVWLLLARGQTTRRQGKEVGREMAARRMEEDGDVILRQKGAFRGKAAEVKTEASISFGDIKTLVRSGRWEEALPGLLALAGFLGLLLFGSLAILLALEDKVVGGLVALAGLLTALRLFIGFVRA